MTWKEVTTSDLFREANPEERAEYKRQFFQKYGVPTLREQGLDDDELNIAANAFFSAPDDTGEGYVTSLASSAARGLLRPVSDIPIAVGALTGSEGIESFGQDIQAGIESALPVNPAQEGIGTELAGIGGQVGSILLGGGGGAFEGTARTGGTGSANQGFAGGAGFDSTVTGLRGAGAGGGAGAVGGAGISAVGGTGGAGVQVGISGSLTYYAGGGGAAGTTTGGSGGAGGGGTGGTSSTAGTANSGGGGGGQKDGQGSSGGSGILILKYPSTYSATFSGGVTQSTSTSGAYKISTITAAGVSDTVSWA